VGLRWLHERGQPIARSQRRSCPRNGADHDPSIATAAGTCRDIGRTSHATRVDDGGTAGARRRCRIPDERAGATALVIVDGEATKRPLGIITEADIVRVVADGKDVNDVRIRDLMTSGLTVCDEKTSIRDAARSMIDGRFRHLPVVEDAGVVGMVEIGDVSRALLNQPH
jgi:CBS domain-containing protein